jgi:hypothetical protein
MTPHKVHTDHAHVHGPACGHRGVRHAGHVDYLHDGHLHTEHGDHFDECTIAVGADNPAACTPGHSCGGHAKDHVHGAGCGHDVVPHGDHVDYLVDGHLHHPHGDHCDDHGPLEVVKS